MFALENHDITKYKVKNECDEYKMTCDSLKNYNLKELECAHKSEVNDALHSMLKIHIQ